jgi:hypothetical protein
MDTPEFLEFWRAYPRREKKQSARDAFTWAMKKHNGDGGLLARILDTIAWQRVMQPDPRYWQMADKWLLGCRWEDEKPLTTDELVEMDQFHAWRKANAHDPETTAVSFEMFRRYQQGVRRAG